MPNEWFATYHPSGVMQDRSRVMRAWLHDIWKIRRILSGAGPRDEDPIITRSTTQEEFDAAVDGWTDFAFDLETDRENQLLVHCLAVSNGPTAVVLDPAYGGELSWVRPLFRRPGVRIVQNGAFDMPILRSHGIDYDWVRTWDTMLANHVLHSDEAAGLAHLASLYLDAYAWKHESVTDLGRYCGIDASRTFVTWTRQTEEAEKLGQAEFLAEAVMPLLWEVIIPLNETGVQVDGPALNKLIGGLQGLMHDWLTDATKIFEPWGGPPVGPKGGLSYPRLSALLYQKLHLPVQRDPDTYQLSVAREALMRLRQHDTSGCVESLLRLSALGEYGKSLEQLQPAADGRCHTRFVLGGDEKHEDLQGMKKDRNAPRTGRLSSREPNLQNLNWKIRHVITASPGLWLCERDYSQIELRLNAWHSKDAGLAAALQAGDAHLYIAWLCDRYHEKYEIARWPWEEVYGRYRDGDPLVKQARKLQKNPTYGWFYRMGAAKLYYAYDIPIPLGRILLNGLNDAFPGIVRWWDVLVELATRQRYLQNPLGRRRYFHDPKEEVTKICNFLAQSGAADILFRALRRIFSNLGREVGRVVLTVHDQVLAEGPDPVLLHQILESCMDIELPEYNGLMIPTDGKTGRNWGPADPELNNPDGMVLWKEAA